MEVESCKEMPKIMAQLLPCYYLAEPLVESELQFLEKTLLGPWAKFKTGASALLQKRVPLVLPAPGPNGLYSEERERRAERVRTNLRHAGIRSDIGRQVVWVMPGNTEWDAIFQYAIRVETGFAPFVAQRWFMEDGALVRRDIRIVDTHMLIQGL
jgi:hypothetical protein